MNHKSLRIINGMYYCVLFEWKFFYSSTSSWHISTLVGPFGCELFHTNKKICVNRFTPF